MYYNAIMKIVNRAYRYRFYPTDEQKKQLSHAFGSSRFVYNHFLKKRTDAYYEKKEKVNYHKTSRLLTELKNDENYCWLKDVSSVTLQQSLRDLDKAFTNFFAGKARYPKFKKRNAKQSVRYVKSGFTLTNGILKIAKNKDPLDIRWSRKFSGEPTSVTISRDCSERYFVSFAIEEPVYTLPKLGSAIGIDVGIKDVCVTSEGFRSGSPQYTRKYEENLAKRQRQLSKKVKGSKNRAKAKLKVARVHAKISDSRNDFNNKMTTKLISENQAIAVESLNVKGMQKNKNLAKSIADSSWGDFFRKLKYKAEWYGRELLEIDRWFPSSKRCSCCGHINNGLKLSDRIWWCPSCKKTLDRDINAAKNILTVGLAELAFGENGRLGNNNLLQSCSL
jgi:putative transposase